MHRPIDPTTFHPELAKVQGLDFSQPDRLMQKGCNHIRTDLKTRPEQQGLRQGC